MALIELAATGLAWLGALALLRRRRRRREAADRERRREEAETGLARLRERRE